MQEFARELDPNLIVIESVIGGGRFSITNNREFFLFFQGNSEMYAEENYVNLIFTFQSL